MIDPEKELEDLVDALHAGAARLSQLVDELFHEPSDDSAEGVDVFGIGRGIERAQPIEQDVRLDDRLLGSRVNARLRAADSTRKIGLDGVRPWRPLELDVPLDVIQLERLEQCIAETFGITRRGVPAENLAQRVGRHRSKRSE